MFLNSLLFGLNGRDLLLNDLDLSLILGVLNLFLVGLDVLLDDLKLFLLSLERNLSDLLNVGLLADLLVDSLLEGLDFLFLDKELLLLLEALNLLLDNLNLLFFFLDLLFLGGDDDLGDSDLLLDFLLLSGNLFQVLSGVGQFSSGGSLLSDNLLLGSDEFLDFLLNSGDVSGNLVNLLLDLRFLRDGNDLKGSLELLSLGDKSVGLSGLLLNLLFDFSYLLGGLLNGGLQLGGLGGKGLNLGGKGSLSILEISLLLLNDFCEFLLSFLGNSVDFLTSLLRLFLFFLDLSDDGLLGLLNLGNKVGDLPLDGSGLLLDNFLLILLSLNLLLDNADLLLSLLGDSGSLGLNKLGLVDLSNFFLVDRFGFSGSDDALSLFLKDFLLLSLLLFNGGLLDGYLSDELGGLDSQIRAHLLVLLLLSWVLGFLGSSAGSLSLNLLLLSNHLLLLVDFLKLGEFL